MDKGYQLPKRKPRNRRFFEWILMAFLCICIYDLFSGFKYISDTATHMTTDYDNIIIHEELTEFGESILGLSGCGPTCLSMAYIHFTKDASKDPREMGVFCEEYGYYTSEGTSWALWTEGINRLGLSGRELSLDENRMKKTLDEGNLIICSMRPGDFTTTGHYILIWSYEEEGFCLNDPNRRSNSEKKWHYDVLRRQIKNLWSIGLGDV